MAAIFPAVCSTTASESQAKLLEGKAIADENASETDAFEILNAAHSATRLGRYTRACFHAFVARPNYCFTIIIQLKYACNYCLSIILCLRQSPPMKPDG